MQKISIWTDEEIGILKKFYPTAPHTELAELLPNRTKNAIKNRAQLLKIKRTASVWSKTELKLLKKYYSKVDYSELQKFLPNKTRFAIKVKARHLNIRKMPPDWTKEEINLLKKHYPTAPLEQWTELLPNRTKASIIAKASKLKIKKTVGRWTEKEFGLLKKHWPSTTSNEELLTLIPNHSFWAIKTKARMYGLTRGKYLPSTKESTVRRWTRDEIDILNLYFYSMNDKDLLLLLPGRTLMAMKHAARELGLRGKELSKTIINERTLWTVPEDCFLIDNFNILPNEELMKLLPKRTLVAIKARANKLGLKRDKNV